MRQTERNEKRRTFLGFAAATAAEGSCAGSAATAGAAAAAAAAAAASLACCSACNRRFDAPGLGDLAATGDGAGESSAEEPDPATFFFLRGMRRNEASATAAMDEHEKRTFWQRSMRPGSSQCASVRCCPALCATQAIRHSAHAEATW